MGFLVSIKTFNRFKGKYKDNLLEFKENFQDRQATDLDSCLKEARGTEFFFFFKAIPFEVSHHEVMEATSSYMAGREAFKKNKEV